MAPDDNKLPEFEFFAVVALLFAVLGLPIWLALGLPTSITLPVGAAAGAISVWMVIRLLNRRGR
jgi:hypothetical protein